jgi:hypothetical protein
MIHAKMFRMSDYYGIKGLCGYAAIKLIEGLETTLFAKINRDVVCYVIKVTSLATAHNNIRLVIGRSLASDFFLFGNLPPAIDLLEKHKELAEYVLHGIFLD